MIYCWHLLQACAEKRTLILLGKLNFGYGCRKLNNIIYILDIFAYLVNQENDTDDKKELFSMEGFWKHNVVIIYFNIT